MNPGHTPDKRGERRQNTGTVRPVCSQRKQAAVVVHEIATPLNIISDRAEVLERVVHRKDPERRHLDVILKQTQRISEIIRALLDYTRPWLPNRRQERNATSDEDIVRARRCGIEVRSAESAGTTVLLRWPAATRNEKPTTDSRSTEVARF